MSAENGQPEYPVGFDPSKFSKPELYLETLQQPGVLTLGAEIESREEIDQLIAEPPTGEFAAIGALALGHAENDEVSYFPIYYTEITSKVGEREFVGPFEVTEEHVGKAEAIVALSPLALTEEEKERWIIRISLMLAGESIGSIAPDDIEFDNEEVNE